MRCHSVVKLLKSQDPDRPIDILAIDQCGAAWPTTCRACARRLSCDLPRGQLAVAKHRALADRLRRRELRPSPCYAGHFQGRARALPGPDSEAHRPVRRDALRRPQRHPLRPQAAAAHDRPVRQPRPAARRAAAGGMAAAGTGRAAERKSRPGARGMGSPTAAPRGGAGAGRGRRRRSAGTTMARSPQRWSRKAIEVWIVGGPGETAQAEADR